MNQIRDPRGATGKEHASLRAMKGRAVKGNAMKRRAMKARAMKGRAMKGQRERACIVGGGTMVMAPAMLLLAALACRVVGYAQASFLFCFVKSFHCYHDIVWHGMVYDGWYNMVWHGMIPFDVVRYGMVLYSMAWCGTVRYCMVYYTTVYTTWGSLYILVW